MTAAEKNGSWVKPRYFISVGKGMALLQLQGNVIASGQIARQCSHDPFNTLAYATDLQHLKYFPYYVPRDTAGFLDFI